MTDPRILADAIDDYVSNISLTTEEHERLIQAWEVVETHAANGVGIEGDQ